MAKAKHADNSHINKPIAVSMAALAMILMLRPGQDGDIGPGFTSGAFAAVPVSDILNKIAKQEIQPQIIPPAVPPLTVVATAQKTEKEPVKQGQRTPATVSTDGPAIVKSEQQDAPVLAVKSVKPTQAETAGLMAKAGSEDQTLKNQPRTTAPAGKPVTILASQFSGLAGTETVYEHVSDKPAYCILGLKPGEICPDEGMVAAQIHKTYFLLDKTTKINATQAKAILDVAVSNSELTKAGIVIVQHDKLDEMGRLMLSVVESAKGTTSTWYDSETGIETQRQIANKGGAYTYEQYDATTAKWSPVKDKSGDDLRIGPSAPTLTAGM